VHYYIYYRVDQARASTLRPIVEAMIASIQQDTGVGGRLLHSEDGSTWMEIYEDVRDRMAFERAMDHALAAADFRSVAGAQCARHTERFVEME